MKVNLKKGDNVKVITGKDKNKEGSVLKVIKDANNSNNTKVVVEGVNVVKKHVKPNQTNQTGGIIETEAAIHISNVKKVEATDKKTKKTK